MEKSLLERLKPIRALVIDLDGTLSDGQLLLLENGELLRRIHIRDAEAIRLAADKKYAVLIISELTSTGTGALFHNLGVRDTYFQVENKFFALERFMLEYEFNSFEIAYMGDDTADILCLDSVGLACCPADAPAEVKEHAHYVSQAGSGAGAVREIIRMIMRSQGHTVI